MLSSIGEAAYAAWCAAIRLHGTLEWGELHPEVRAAWNAAADAAVSQWHEEQPWPDD